MNRKDVVVLTLRDFIVELSARSPESNDLASALAGDVVTTSLFGLDVVAVVLAPDVLNEDRVAQMNVFWDELGEREALVVAVSPPRG